LSDAKNNDIKTGTRARPTGRAAPAGRDEKGPDAAENGGRMGFFEHLAELRRRLIVCVIIIAVFTAAAWNYADVILDLVMDPVLRYLPREKSLVYTGLPDAFSVTFRIALWAGFVASAPLTMWQLWAFVAPGLRREERSKVPVLTLLATVLFLSGVAFAYFVAFPLTFRFFLTFSSDVMQPLLTVDRYMSLVMSLVLAFALSFQLPLVLMFLARLGIVGPEFLSKNRSYAIVVIFVVAAFLTPPDVVSQIILAAALMLLYEFSVLLVRRQHRARLAAEAGEAGEEAGEAEEAAAAEKKA
jgi:sec-independent protein translocase protein TatC